MTQTVPATAVLGPGKTGLTIGLRVLNLDGTTYAAFSTTGVAETSVAGTYRKAGGVVCPDAGAYLVWGVSGTDYAEATVDSTAVNVTLWKGVDADTAIVGADGDTLETLSDQIDGLGSGLTAQQTRDAMMLAPSAGTPAAGSVDKHLDDILEDTGTTLPAALANVGATVTVVSAVSGGDITVYANDTWEFTVSSDSLSLSGYEALALVVKRTASQEDSDALLYLRSDTGLVRIDGAAPGSANNGTLASTATSFTGTVAISETAGVTARSNYVWWLKGFDTTPTPDEGFTLATGKFTIMPAGLQAIA